MDAHLQNVERLDTIENAENVIDNGSIPEIKSSDLNERIPSSEKTTEDEDVIEPSRVRNAKYDGWKWYAMCLSIYSAALLYGLDNTIVADVQAAVVTTFGKIDKLGWLGIGFPLGSIGTILSLAKAYSIFNVKWLYIGSLIMFAAGSALCGGAPTMNALIVGRVWAGAGGAGMYLGVLNIITINTTERERSLYISLINVVWGIGCILGPVIRGSFADSSVTWRWSFYINLIILGVCSPIYLFILQPFQPQPEVSILDKLRNLDWLGVILNAGVYTTFVVLFTFGGVIWPWNDGRTITLFVMCGVIVIAFLITQYLAFLTTPASRLFPIDFLYRPTLVLLYVATAANATALFVPIYYIPIYFQFVYGDSGLEAAVRLLPFICSMIFATLLSGILLPKLGYYKPWYIASGMLLITGGTLFFKTVNSSTSHGAIYGYSILLALGAAFSQQAAYSIAPILVEPHRAPEAIGFINTAQIGGFVSALTITSSVFQNIGFHNVETALRGLGFTSDDIREALAGTRSPILESTSPQVRSGVVNGIVEAIDDVYIVILSAGVVTLICGILMKNKRLFLKPAIGA